MIEDKSVLKSVWVATVNAWTIHEGLTREQVVTRLLEHISPLAAKEVLKSV